MLVQTDKWIPNAHCLADYALVKNLGFILSLLFPVPRRTHKLLGLAGNSSSSPFGYGGEAPSSETSQPCSTVDDTIGQPSFWQGVIQRGFHRRWNARTNRGELIELFPICAGITEFTHCQF